MKLILVFGLLFLSPFAQARAPTRYLSDLTCAELKYVVRAHQRITLCARRFDCYRFVASEIFCPEREIAINAFVPTKDNPRCTALVCRHF